MTDAIDLFFANGCQYYVAGRYAAFAGLNPVVGNILHHAIEHFLKGALSKSKTFPELKRLGHHLSAVWAAFKVQVNNPALAQFDGVISTLHEFEELRYPDSVLTSGMQCTINITKAGAAMTRVTSNDPAPPTYQLCLEDIDELVRAIFVATSRNPKAYFQGLFKLEAQEYLIKDNKVNGFVK
jgi:hypothetical protein